MSGFIDVIAAGMQTTVQDLGRWGHQSIGVSVAGAMDPYAHRLANALVGNARTAATLEVTMRGPALQFHDDRTVAVAGGQFDLFLNDLPVPGGVRLSAAAGSVLRFGGRRVGARAYVAIAGGVDVPVVLGSRATHVPTAMGGFQGRALARGDRIPLGSQLPDDSRVPTQVTSLVNSGSLAVVRVLAGPQDDRFAAGTLDLLTRAPYVVTAESDRMGFRLEGTPLVHRGAADIISDATPAGSIQVPASGQPVLLMADRQTTGGYAKLATVISADVGIAAQVAPGEQIQFRLCSRAEALTALVGREGPLLAIEPEAR